MGHVLKQQFNISKNMSFTCFSQTSKQKKPLQEEGQASSMRQPLRNSAALYLRKKLARVLQNHLVAYLELGLLPESQDGFHIDYFCCVPTSGEFLGTESWIILLTSQKPLILLASKACGGSCQSLAVLSNSFRWCTNSMMAWGPESWTMENPVRYSQSPMVLKKVICLHPTLFSRMFIGNWNQPQG